MTQLDWGIFMILCVAIGGLIGVLWGMAKKEREQWRLNRAINERRWNGEGKEFLWILLTLGLAAPLPAQAAVNYDIVYVRAPRYGDVTPTRWPEVKDPITLEPGTDIMLRHPDGSQEVLVSGGIDGAAIDPFPSFDALSIYYAKCPNVRQLTGNYVPVQGCDIYKMRLATRQETRLTWQEWTPSTGVGTWCANPAQTTGTCNRPGYGVFNLGPAPLAGGKVVFVSSRNGYIPNIAYTRPNLQLFVLDENTGITHFTGILNLGSALHPFPLQDGTLAFSSFESQGLRDSRLWSLWRIYPDGRNWAPLWSAMLYPFSAHFATQLTDGRVVSTLYYNENRQGFGPLLAFTPLSAPQGRPVFGSPKASDPSNSLLDWGCLETPPHAALHLRFPFSPYDLFNLTPFANAEDRSTGCRDTAGRRKGAMTHPSAALDNTLLVVWSKEGPAAKLPKPENLPRPDGGIYLMDALTQVTDPGTQLELIINDPAYNEQQPHAIVPWAAIHGTPEPPILPWLPREDDRLLPGEASAFIGSSSLCWHDADSENTGSNYRTQGSSIGKGRYSCDDIYALRIVNMQGTSAKHYGTGAYGFNHANWFQQLSGFHNERLAILGEYPVLKVDPTTGQLLTSQQPDGVTVPDTSFMIRIPCNAPFTFQALDIDARPLNYSGTWHYLGCGAKYVSCGGCHAHAHVPMPFQGTAASLPGYPVPDFTQVTPLLAPGGGLTYQSKISVTYEFARDIAPILTRVGLPATYAATSPRAIPLNAHDSPIMADLAGAGGTPEELMTMARWISLGGPLDKGGWFLDDNRPALHLHKEGGTLYVGASDDVSGIDVASLTVTLDGAPLALTPGPRQTWSAPCLGGGRVVARIRDIQGNWTQVEEQF